MVRTAYVRKLKLRPPAKLTPPPPGKWPQPLVVLVKVDRLSAHMTLLHFLNRGSQSEYVILTEETEDFDDFARAGYELKTAVEIEFGRVIKGEEGSIPVEREMTCE
jgi:hypothetical protein